VSRLGGSSEQKQVLMQNRKDTKNQITDLDYLRYTTLYHPSSRLQENCYPQCYPRLQEGTRHCLQSTVATKSKDRENPRWVNMHDQESTSETGRRNSLSRSFHVVYPKNKAEKPCPQNPRQRHGCRVNDGRISLRLRHQPPKPMMIEILLL